MYKNLQSKFKINFSSLKFVSAVDKIDRYTLFHLTPFHAICSCHYAIESILPTLSSEMMEREKKKVKKEKKRKAWSKQISGDLFTVVLYVHCV